ncbi:MAG: FecR domain-containing protein [Janthinobacterium lividum]
MNAVPPSIAQAIEWYALQGSGSFNQEAQQRFQGWLESDPSHREAWHALNQQLNRNLAPLARQQGARQALSHSGRQRRALLRGALGLGTLAVGSHLLTRPGWPLHERWGADLRTATAERRHFVLADGSDLLLNAQSAVDLHYSARQRRVQLLRGDVLAQVQAEASRAFVVQCPWAEVWLDGGRCLLSLQPHSAQVWALEGELELRAQGTRQRLKAGQGRGFDTSGNGWQPLSDAYIDQRAWVSGLLEVHDQPLSAVIDALRPYHPGLLQVSSRAAGLRISGVFTLDDSQQALAALKDVLPLRIDQYLGWWTRVDHA